MIQKQSYLKFWILFITLNLSTAYNTVNAQEKTKNRLNIEWVQD